MKKFLFSLALIFGLAMFFVTPVQAKVPTPQIYNVVHSAENSFRPWVIGWTPNEVEVEIFMDDVSQGMAKVVKDKSGTASFGWSPQSDLALGWHEFRVRGKYHDDYSELGGVIGYKVSQPTPAPTIFAPEEYDDYILIKGLIKNDSVVKVYIDDKLVADFVVPNHPSGTTNWWYKAKGLLNGVHEVYAVAYDSTGKPSKKSQIINFKTEQQKITKGNDEVDLSSSTTNQSPTTNQVIDEPAAGKVTIVDDQVSGEAKVEVSSATSENSVVVTEDTAESNGETSSISEVNEDPASSQPAVTKESKNRYVGLFLLGLATVLLYVWYWREKKKTNQSS